MTRYWELKHEDGQDDADLYIFGDIMSDKEAYKGKNDRSAMDVVTAIENLTAKNLTVHINSYGGDVKEGLAIYNCIKIGFEFCYICVLTVLTHISIYFLSIPICV